MRMKILAMCAIVFATSLAAAQKPAGRKAPKVLTLSGCIEADAKTPNQFTLTDQKAHRTYRLTGIDLREYLGRPVQLDGGVVVKGVKIAGGLQPNANVAGQAGAMDPSRAIVAGAAGIGPTGTVDDVQEFRVKTVRSAGGTCPNP
jgi:hypothetical protein